MYILLSLIVLILSVLLFRKAAGTLSPTKINMISWIFYFDLLLQSYFSAILTIYNVDDHYMISKIGDPMARIYGYYAIMYTMLALPFGMILANRVWKTNIRLALDSYTSKPIVPLISQHDSFLRYPLYVFSFVSILSVLYTFYVIREIPIVEMFSGTDAMALAGLREDVGREFPGNVFVRNIFGLLLTPILSYIAYAYFRITKSLSDRGWFYTMFVFSILIITYNIAKAPLAMYLLGFLFFRILEKGSIKKMTLIYAGLGVLALLVAFYVMLGSSDMIALFSLRYGILGRVLLSQSSGIYLSFDTFPYGHDFLGISSFSDMISVLGIHPSERSARILMEIYNPTAFEEGTGGVMNSLFIAEAWANFGFIGLIIAPVYVGFLVQSMFIFFLRQPKTPILIALFSYFSYKSAINGGFNEYLYNPLMLLLIVIGVLILFTAKYLRTVKYQFTL